MPLERQLHHGIMGGGLGRVVVLVETDAILHELIPNYCYLSHHD